MPEVKPHRRRSARLARRVKVFLRWTDPEGTPHEEVAETVVLSRYGGLLLCPTSFKAGEDVSLWWPEQGRGARIRVVFREWGRTPDLAEVGFEFTEPMDFWGIEFPPDKPPWENPLH